MAEVAERKAGIADYMEAGYPCLFLQTVESEVAERRVRDAMLELEEKEMEQPADEEMEAPLKDAELFIWKVTGGGLLLGTARTKKKQMHVNSDVRDLIQALDYIREAKKPKVGIFHNVRQFVANPNVIQALQDAILAARLSGSHIIIVGPNLDVPPELRSLMTYVDCPLPTVKEIESQYESFVTAYEKKLILPEEDEERKALVRHAATAAVGLDTIGAENAMALSIALRRGIDIKIIYKQKEQEVRKQEALEFVSSEEGLDVVGGFGEYKSWLQKREDVFTDEAREYGLPFPKGVLIVGPPGSGKSLVAKATGHYLKLPLLRLDIGKLFRSYVGESEGVTRLVIQVVEAVAPVVLWIDEIDKGFAGMQSSGNLDSGVTKRVIGTLLTWRQETKAAVFVAATANTVVGLDSMVYRKGRFDEVWGTDLPNEEERAEIFRIHLKKRGRKPEKFDLEKLVGRAEHFSGAEIEGCIEDGMFTAFKDKRREVETKHILLAMDETIPMYKRDAEEIKVIREWIKDRARPVSSEPGEDSPERMGFMKEGRRKVRLPSKN